KNKFVFETWLWLKRSESKVMAGVYNIPINVSIRQLANILVIGPEDSQASLTLLEGWTRQMMADYFDKKNLSGQDFMTQSARKQNWQEDFDFLTDAPSNVSLEGYIFPDTYYIDNYTTVDDVIIKALNNFDRKLTDDLREEISRQGKTIFEVVNLASIIEREVPQFEDKKMIADVFLKRLEASIGLQSDATINYITGKGLLQPTLEDLEIDSPYNTYKYRGLPPGPIANPGIDSIKAVVYPTSNDYYYFLTTPEGEVIYSINYEEHLDNKYKYLD
ncbi:endolytic transglycosylase MltG, partial [bacterium]|nr:endolytic transglycosylase MltG [bacterium]